MTPWHRVNLAVSLFAGIAVLAHGTSARRLAVERVVEHGIAVPVLFEAKVDVYLLLFSFLSLMILPLVALLPRCKDKLPWFVAGEAIAALFAFFAVRFILSMPFHGIAESVGAAR